MMSVDVAKGKRLNTNILVYDINDVTGKIIAWFGQERSVDDTISRRPKHIALLLAPCHRPPVLDGVTEKFGKAAGTK